MDPIDSPSSVTASPHVLVVGVSFDAAGELAWRQTVRTFAKRPSEIHLCHVVDPRDRRALPVDSPTARSRLLDERCDELQIFALEKVTEFVRQSGSRVRLHVTFGDVAEKLVDYAVETRAEAIVIGDHTGPGAPIPERGTTASRLVRMSPCSVLVVRPASYEKLAPAAMEPDPFALSDDDEEEATARSFPFQLSATRTKEHL